MDAERRQIVAQRLKAEMGKRGLTQARLAEMSTYDERTIRNVIKGLTVKDTTLYQVCATVQINLDEITSARPEPPRAGNATAPEHMGGYTRALVEDYIGQYLTLRPAFSGNGSVCAFATVMEWDEQQAYVVFKERNRADAHYSHTGSLYVPAGSMFVYLVSLTKGWLRSVVVSHLGPRREMRGIVTTLHNSAGAMYLPVAAPIVYLKRDAIAAEEYGTIAPGEGHFAKYAAILEDTIASSYARLVSGVGAPALPPRP